MSGAKNSSRWYRRLIESARKSRKRAYAPYSKFKVGAAVLTENGKIYSACNVENASYGLTICAERAAIFKAVSEGETKIQAVAVVADGPDAASPCGACRQVIFEFGSKATVVMSNLKGQIVIQEISYLLPRGFSLQRK